MRPESGAPEDCCDRDRRLQAISEAHFSLPQTQTAQIADSATVVLPAATHDNSGTVGEICFGIDKRQHAKLKEDYLRIKDCALKT